MAFEGQKLDKQQSPFDRVLEMLDQDVSELYERAKTLKKDLAFNLGKLGEDGYENTTPMEEYESDLIKLRNDVIDIDKRYGDLMAEYSKDDDAHRQLLKLGANFDSIYTRIGQTYIYLGEYQRKNKE